MMTSLDPEIDCDAAHAKPVNERYTKGQPGRESSGVEGIRRIP